MAILRGALIAEGLNSAGSSPSPSCFRLPSPTCAQSARGAGQLLPQVRGNRIRQEWRYRVPDLCEPITHASVELEGVWKGLQAGSFAK